MPTALLLLAACGGTSRTRRAGGAGRRRPRLPARGRATALSRRPQQPQAAAIATSTTAVPRAGDRRLELVEPVPKVEPRSRYGNKSDLQRARQGPIACCPIRRGYVERGIASWYGNKFHGYMTSIARAVRHVSVLRRAQDAAAADLRARDQSRERQERGRAHQRSRAVPREPADRPLVRRRGDASASGRRAPAWSRCARSIPRIPTQELPAPAAVTAGQHGRSICRWARSAIAANAERLARAPRAGRPRRRRAGRRRERSTAPRARRSACGSVPLARRGSAADSASARGDRALQGVCRTLTRRSRYELKLPYLCRTCHHVAASPATRPSQETPD